MAIGEGAALTCLYYRCVFAGGVPLVSTGGPENDKALQTSSLWVRSVGDGYGADVGRMLDVDQLVPARAIAERLGFKRVQLVHYYFRSDPTFPAPVFTLAEAARPLRLWYWPEVESWWEGRRRRPPSVEAVELAKNRRNPRSAP